MLRRDIVALLPAANGLVILTAAPGDFIASAERLNEEGMSHGIDCAVDTILRQEKLCLSHTFLLHGPDSVRPSEKVVGVTTIGKRLKRAREAAGYSRVVDAIKAFGWSQQYYQHENDTTPPSKDALVSYSRGFNVRLEWLMTGNGSPNERARRVPVMGALGRGMRIESDTGNVPGRFELTRADDETSTVSILVESDENHPFFSPGDVVFGGPEEDPALLIGKQAIVTLADGWSGLRMIAGGSRPDVFTLWSFGYPEAPRHDVSIVAAYRVTWVRKS